MQNSKVYFSNPGYFDVTAMLTFGLSAKASDSAIGFFGTGFKYAVAIVLRELGSIKITTKNEDGEIEIYSFVSRKKTVRGSDFDVVYLIDHKDGSEREAGFTTRLGINWEPWMAFRELHCNASDEGGKSSDRVDISYDTIIEVDCDEIYKAYTTQSDYFIGGEPLMETGQVQVFKGGKPFIYYRGVAVRNAVENQVFGYNIKSPVALTEDRTAKYDYQIFWPITRMWQNHCDDRAMLRKVVRSGDHGEARIGFDPDWGSSETFTDVCAELMKTDVGVCESARLVAAKKEAVRGDWPEFELSAVQQKMLERAIHHLGKIDVNVSMYPVKTVTGLGDNVMGRALDGVIYLSEIPFNMGTKQVASTLLEEWVHNKTGAADFDRAMQSWLFDKVLSLAETISGEPI